MKVRSFQTWTDATSLTAGGIDGSPALIAWAVVTIWLCPFWR